MMSRSRAGDRESRRTSPGRLILAVIVLAGLVALSGVIHYNTQDEVTFTVSEKDREYKPSSSSSRNGGTSSGSHVYVVKSKEGETFTNRGNYFALKFRSRPLQDSLHQGEKYTCKVSGLRSFLPEFLSRGEGRNLNSCEPAE